MTNIDTTGNIMTGEGRFDLSTFKDAVDKKFIHFNILLVTGFIILLVMVATLIIDSFHFNSATYREYSEKMQALDSLQDTNQTLLEQNKKNQELILQQQSQILQLLKNQQK